MFLAPTPDGSRLAFIARNGSGVRALWIRPLASAVATRLAGTEGVSGVVFWSPDGRFIGFFADGKLKKIEASGGPAFNFPRR